jgi:hypothetical protein
LAANSRPQRRYIARSPLQEPALKWLNVRSLAAACLRPNQTMERVVFSTASCIWKAGKLRRSRPLEHFPA